MKKYLGLLILPFLLSSCSNDKLETFSYLENDSINHTIYITSDLHYLDPSFLDPNIDYDVEDHITDGRTLEYNEYLIDELIRTTLNSEAELLILTGDLACNGEKTSHKSLVNKLSQLKNEGIDVLAIPGNHDLNNYGTFKIDEKVDLYTPENYKEDYFSLFDQNKVVFDKASLSYFYHLDDSNWLLLFDSAIYQYNDESDPTTTLGFIQQETLVWAEEQLKIAKKDNIKVIPFSHHNLINHHPNFTTLYDLYNAEDVQTLYAKYNIDLHFSGHLHIQNISSKKVNKKTIYDIASNSLTVYGNQIGKLELSDNATYYQAIPLDHASIEFDFDAYMFELFKRRYQTKIINNYTSYFSSSKENNEFVEYLGDIQAWFFKGNLNLHLKEVKSNKYYNTLKKIDNKFFTEAIKNASFHHQWLIIK